jgi:RNAse (barnase) inhibitor barstar
MKPALEISGDNINSLEDFYDEFTKLLSYKGWGKNLDALDDLFAGGFGLPEEAFVLKWHNSSKSKEKLGVEETLKWRQSHLDRDKGVATKETLGEIENLKQGKGKTLFELILEILKDNSVEVELL